MVNARPPTPQVISALLGRAGFSQSLPAGDPASRTIISGYSRGYEVATAVTEPGVVVRWWPGPHDHTLADARSVLARYAPVITGAGWDVRMDRHELVVTSKTRTEEK